MIYTIVFGVLFAVQLVYMRIARNSNVIVESFEQSQTDVRLRGGGTIFWVAALLYSLIYPSEWSWWFMGGITLMAGVSFWDDIKSVRPIIRLLLHLLGMTCAFMMVGAFSIFPWWAMVLAYIVFIGIVNAFRIMDGVNCITGLYTMAVLLPLLCINMTGTKFTENAFIIIPLLASVVFLIFNFRKKAKCFAGDVGSVAIAFWLVSLLLMLIIKTNDLIWIGFLMVYGVDTVCTIIHRIYLKQNIMEPHRLHFYQILANEMKTDHRDIAIAYFLAQMLCSALIILLYPIVGWGVFFALLVALLVVYGKKFYFIKEAQDRNY